MNDDFDLERAANEGADILAKWFPDLAENEDRVDLYRCARAILMNAPNCPPVVDYRPALLAVVCKGAYLKPEDKIISTYPVGEAGDRKAKWQAKTLELGTIVKYEAITLYRQEKK